MRTSKCGTESQIPFAGIQSKIYLVKIKYDKVDSILCGLFDDSPRLAPFFPVKTLIFCLYFFITLKVQFFLFTVLFSTLSLRLLQSEFNNYLLENHLKNLTPILGQ